MTQTIAESVGPRSAVLERRPHWSEEREAQQALDPARNVDAHGREAAITFSVLSWQHMRLAVTRPLRLRK
jgi:hypothetical protein